MSSNRPATDLEFLHEKPLSLRAVSQAWVNQRARELNPEDPDYSEALQEVFDRLVTRLGPNFKEGGECRIYAPSNDEDPYVFSIEIEPRSLIARQELSPDEIQRRREIEDKGDQTKLRLDFEMVLAEAYPDVGSAGLTRKPNGDYENKTALGMWKGFSLYHRTVMLVKRLGAPFYFTRLLGRFVIGKVNKDGGVIFQTRPYRHNSKTLAIAEATRLSKTHNQPFAIFRCLEIISEKTDQLPVELVEEVVEETPTEAK